MRRRATSSIPRHDADGETQLAGKRSSAARAGVPAQVGGGFRLELERVYAPERGPGRSTRSGADGSNCRRMQTGTSTTIAEGVMLANEMSMSGQEWRLEVYAFVDEIVNAMVSDGEIGAVDAGGWRALRARNSDPQARRQPFHKRRHGATSSRRPAARRLPLRRLRCAASRKRKTAAAAW